MFFTRLLKEFKRRASVDFMLEPGAVLVNNACHAVAQVQYVNDTNKEQLYYHIDLGPTLGLRKPVSRLFSYGKSREIAPRAIIVDSTCAKKFVALLLDHARLDEGDIVVFPEVGMYSLPYISDFHLLKRPSFVYLH
jgi:diaminopimelate decarboxylase